MRLIPGTFKGFPYYITSYSVDGENFTKNHDFTNNKKNIVENFGGKPMQFSLDMIIKGNTPEEFHEVREEFIELLREEGTAELVHPYLGTLIVVPKSFSHKGGEADGIAEFTVNFIEEKQDDELIIDYKFEQKQALENFNETAEVEISRLEQIRDLINEFYRKLENSIVSTLQTVSSIKNFLDYDEYIEKVNSLIDLTTNKDYWNNIFEFFIDYFTFQYHSKHITNFYKKFLNLPKQYILGNELKAEQLYIHNYNLMNEGIKYAAILKLTELAFAGKLENIDIDFLLRAIKISKQDQIIQDTYEVLDQIENKIYEYKNIEKKITLSILTPTPALVIAYENKIDINKITATTYNINEIQGQITI